MIYPHLILYNLQNGRSILDWGVFQILSEWVMIIKTMVSNYMYVYLGENMDIYIKYKSNSLKI